MTPERLAEWDYILTQAKSEEDLVALLEQREEELKLDPFYT